MRVVFHGPEPFLGFLFGPASWVVTLEAGRATYRRLGTRSALIDCPMHIFEIEARGRRVVVSDGEQTHWTGVLTGDFEADVRAVRRHLEDHGSPNDVPPALRDPPRS